MLIGELKTLDPRPREATKPQKQLLKQLETLASKNNWRACFKLAEMSMNRSDVSEIWNRLHEYRGIAAEQIGEWESGAFSWLWIASEDGLSEEESARRTERGIICHLNSGKYDDAEKGLHDALWEYLDFEFTDAFAEFKRLNFALCFQKPESERLSSLLIVPSGRDSELDVCHERSRLLEGLNSAIYADIIHRLNSFDFICLFELCRNPVLEAAFCASMMSRCAKSIERDREFIRCKEAEPIIPLDRAMRVLRNVERLARASARRRSDTPEYGGDFYSAVFKLIP